MAQDKSAFVLHGIVAALLFIAALQDARKREVSNWISIGIFITAIILMVNQRHLDFTGLIPGTIMATLYGRNADDKVQRTTVERLLPCIFNGARIPNDLVRAAIARASAPMAMERWEWNRTLSIACALYNKQHEKEGFGLALDETRKDRSYLFGRLLAVADQLERRALMESGEKRETTAMRLMSAFAQRPVKTWTVIAGHLRSYQKKLGRFSRYYDDLITRITSMFDQEDYDPTKDRPLDGLYLLGYHNQRQTFLDAIKDAKEKKDAEKLNTLSNATESEEE